MNTAFNILRRFAGVPRVRRQGEGHRRRSRDDLLGGAVVLGLLTFWPTLELRRHAAERHNS